MKKLLALILMLALAGSTIPAFAWDGKVETVTMAWLTGGTDNPYMNDVQTLISDYTRDKIGVEVNFKQVSIFDAASAYTRWIAGREDMDIAVMAYTPMTPFISMNMIMPLDDLLEDAPAIKDLAEKGYSIYDPNTTGHVYGLAMLNRPYAGVAGAIYVFEDAIQSAGLAYEDHQRITLEDADKIARAYKAVNEKAYVNLVGSAPKGHYSFVYDNLGADLSSGTLIGTDSTTVVNAFESEEYQNYLKTVRGWYQDGLILKDAPTTDIGDAGSMLKDPDNCFMTINSADLGLVKNYATQTGKRIYQLYLTDLYQPAVSQIGSFMAIPVTSKHPEAAMRLMNLLYEDTYVITALYNGIEGVTYNYSDENRNAVVPIWEKNYLALGLYGNAGLNPPLMEYDEDFYAQLDVWEAEAVKNPTKGVGFAYDASNMTNQITAVDAVLAEYRASLETGSVDLDKVYPEFIQKLKMNGIDQIIADKQAQFNEWLAQQ